MHDKYLVLKLSMWVIIASLILLFTAQCAYAAGLEESAEAIQMSGSQRLDKGFGLHTPYNAKRILEIIKAPFSHGMSINSDIGVDTTYVQAFETNLTNSILQLETSIGKIKETNNLTDEQKNKILQRYRGWLYEVRYIPQIIEVPVIETCKQENIVEKIKSMTLNEILKLVNNQ